MNFKTGVTGFIYTPCPEKNGQPKEKCGKMHSI